MSNPYDADLQLKMARNHLQLFNSVVPPAFLDLYERVKSNTMLSIERLYDIYLGCNYVNKRGLNGSVVEVGTWKCGALAMAILSNTDKNRGFVGFDTFEGHFRPAADEYDIRGHSMRDRWDEMSQRGELWAAADLEECWEFLRSLNIDGGVHLIKGDVKETIRNFSDSDISILRVDCDWYEESRVTLETFYPRVVTGGLIILDDYGHHTGQRQAADEYFSNIPVKLTHVDYSCVTIVKTE